MFFHKSHFILFFFLLVFGVDVIAQNCECNKADLLNKDFNEYIDMANFKAASNIADELLKEPSQKCKFEALNKLFEVNQLQKKFLEAKFILLEQEKLLKRMDCDSIPLLIKNYTNWAVYNYRQGSYTDAIKYCYQVIPLAESINDIRSIITSKQIIVQVLSYMNRDKESSTMAQQCYSIIMNAPESAEKADYMVWLVKHYDGFYNLEGNPAYLDTMNMLLHQGIEVARKFNNKDALIESYISLDYSCYYTENYKLGLSYLDSAFMIVNYNKDRRELARMHSGKAWDYALLGQFSKAFFHHDSSLYYFKNYYQDYELSLGYTDGAEIYAMSGDFKTAYSYYQKGISIRDSLSSVNVSNTITELEQKYNKEVNERTITELNQEKVIANERQNVARLRTRLLIGVIILILLLVVIIIFIYRQRLLKQKQEKLEVEQRLNRSRMNPHFFFNALTSLQDLSLDPTRNKDLAIYLGKYSKIMRQTLESTYHELISVEEELDYIKKYLDIQLLRFPDKFVYQINVSDEIDPEEYEMPAMLLQPFIENSIEHGFHQIQYQGKVEINVIPREGQLVVEIIDNGSKSDKESAHKGYPSRAIQIITDRLRLLNESRRSKASFSISEGLDGKGYKIVLVLPIIKSS